MIGELNETQINNVLSSQVLGRLACTDGINPYIVPLTFVFDGNFIYAQTNDGQKLCMLRKNPLVCFETDVMTDMANWQSVLVYGSFEELQGDDAERGRRILFHRVFSLMTNTVIHGHEHHEVGETDDSNRVKRVLFRIKIEKLTGRYERR